MSRARAAEGGRGGTVLMGLGILAVLGVTFVAGVTTGRHWSARSWMASRAAAQTEAPAPRPSAPATDRTRALPTPPLTFYEQLTAPLPPGPSGSKPAAGDRRPSAAAGRTEPAPVKEMKAPSSGPVMKETRAPASPAVAAKETSAAGPATEAKKTAPFTVQVGAFKDRAQAESLRARLATEWSDAYVAELEGPAPYRVRVGAYDTRDAARRVAARLGSDHRLRPFITRR